MEGNENLVQLLLRGFAFDARDLPAFLMFSDNEDMIDSDDEETSEIPDSRIENPEELISTLEVTQLTEQCSICLEASGDGVALSCGHIFHSSWLMTWISRKASCPLCKTLTQTLG